MTKRGGFFMLEVSRLLEVIRSDASGPITGNALASVAIVERLDRLVGVLSVPAEDAALAAPGEWAAAPEHDKGQIDTLAGYIMQHHSTEICGSAVETAIAVMKQAAAVAGDADRGDAPDDPSLVAAVVAAADLVVEGADLAAGHVPRNRIEALAAELKALGRYRSGLGGGS